jgi:Uma2 family endonuclease
MTSQNTLPIPFPAVGRFTFSLLIQQGILPGIAIRWRKPMSTVPRCMLEATYYAEAQAYLHRLRPEDLMESTTQATQRKITVFSLDLVRLLRPDIQTFNELLVQYSRGNRKKPGQVVPDNMVVVYEKPIQAETSYDVPLQPVGPFWVLEYVSKNNKRKDFETNLRKYEQELKVPYYLIFYPEAQEMTLFHHDQGRYHTVQPNAQGRVALPELELELALLDGWVRFWFRGQLLPLPAELQRDLNQTRAQLAQAEQRAEAERRAREAAEQQVAELQARLARLAQSPEEKK